MGAPCLSIILYHPTGLDFPSVAAVEQIVNALVLAVGAAFVHLVLIQLAVGNLFDVADDAEGNRKIAAHAGQHHVDAGVLSGLIVNHDVIHRDAILADGYGFKATTIETETAVPFFAENHRLAVFEHDGAVVANSTIGDGSMSFIVENHTVLQNLHHARTVVKGGACHDVCGQVRHAVEGSREESSLGTHHQLARVERVVNGSERRSLRDLAELGGRAVLPLGQTVFLIMWILTGSTVSMVELALSLRVPSWPIPHSAFG